MSSEEEKTEKKQVVVNISLAQYKVGHQMLSKSNTSFDYNFCCLVPYSYTGFVTSVKLSDVT